MGEEEPETPEPPRTVQEGRSPFDRMADRVTYFLSRGPFFVISLLVIAGWLGVAGPVMGWSPRWADAGMLALAGVSFVLLIMLENAQRRSDQAIQRKLNALADALADFMARQEVDDNQVEELRAAVGLEHRESTRRGRPGRH